MSPHNQARRRRSANAPTSPKSASEPGSGTVNARKLSTVNVAELAARLGMKYRYGARGQFSHSNIITVLNPRGEIVRQQTGLNQDIAETIALTQQIADSGNPKE